MQLNSASLGQSSATVPPPREPSARPLGLFFVAMLMFGITTTLHGLSPLATYGLGAVFFYCWRSSGSCFQQP